VASPHDASTANFDAWKDSYRDEVQKVVAFSEPGRQTILDIGCGVGVTDRYLVGRFGRVVGVDVFDGVLERAAAANPDADYRLYDGHTLPLDDGSVDVAFAICVVHHVPPPHWERFAAEMARVVRPGGIAAVFEHNPVNPLTRRVVSNCVFDEDAVLLRRSRAARLLRDAGLMPAEDRYIAFLPFRGRVVGSVEAALRRVPLGAQYYVSATRV
jgi:SAM-dependent methyltransferase